MAKGRPTKGKGRGKGRKEQVDRQEEEERRRQEEGMRLEDRKEELDRGGNTDRQWGGRGGSVPVEEEDDVAGSCSFSSSSSCSRSNRWRVSGRAAILISSDPYFPTHIHIPNICILLPDIPINNKRLGTLKDRLGYPCEFLRHLSKTHTKRTFVVILAREFHGARTISHSVR